MFELISKGASLEVVLDRIVELAKDEFGSIPVSVDVISSQDSRLCTMASSSNLPADYAARLPLIARSDLDCAAQGSKNATDRDAGAVDADYVAAEVRQASLDVGMQHCLPSAIWTAKGQFVGFLTVHGKPSRRGNARSRLDSLVRLTRIAIEWAQEAQFADRQFATLAATIPGVVYQRLLTTDGDIRYTYISEGCRDLFGLDSAEILADPNKLFDCFGAEYRATFKDRLLAASKSLTLWDVEVQIVTPDGEEKWTHAIARPHRQLDGSVLWTGVILDLTRIKNAELELRRTEEEAERASHTQAELVAKLRTADARFASLARTIPGVVYQRLVTPDGDIRYTYISDGARDLFGVEPAEIIADPQVLFGRHGPEYRETFRERLLAASRSLTMWDVEAQIVTPDGEEKWTHAIARPHRQPDGSVLWDGVILDATRIKAAELGLRRAKDAAEKASNAKTQFLASMSHELRTPLNAVIGFSEILKSEVYGPLGNTDYVQYADYVFKSAHGLLETINSILEFTRFETFDVEINERSVNIGEIIQAAVSHARRLAHDANIEIVGPPVDQLPTLICDEEMVRRMLVHLLSNGVKFTPEDGQVEIGVDYLPTGELAVTIKDDGIGISEEDMPKIFEAFGQIDGTLSRHYGGSGLGVPLAMSMARLHRAELKFESKVGNGTVATVVFPSDRVIVRARRQAAR